MDVELSERSLARIRAKVESGSFASADEVIEQALGLLEDREREYGEWLRAEVAKGQASADAGRVTPVDAKFLNGLRDQLGMPRRDFDAG
jgi:putative addiction module CopG family antidote